MRGRHRRRGPPGGRRRRRARRCSPATSSASSTCRRRGWPRCAATAGPRGYFRLDVDLDRAAPWADERVPTRPSCTSPATSTSWRMSQAQVRRGLLPDAAAAHRRPAGPRRPHPRAARRGQPLGGVPLPGAAPTGEDGDWAAGFADRVLDRLEAHAPGLRDAGRRHDGPAAAGPAGARPQPGRRRRRGRVRVARPAAGVPAGRGLVAVRAAGRAGCGCAARRRTRAAACTGCAGATPRARSCDSAAAQALGCVRIVASSKCIGSVYCQSPPQAKPQRLKISTTRRSMVPRMPR